MPSKLITPADHMASGRCRPAARACAGSSPAAAPNCALTLRIAPASTRQSHSRCNPGIQALLCCTSWPAAVVLLKTTARKNDLARVHGQRICNACMNGFDQLIAVLELGRLDRIMKNHSCRSGTNAYSSLGHHLQGIHYGNWDDGHTAFERQVELPFLER